MRSKTEKFKKVTKEFGDKYTLKDKISKTDKSRLTKMKA
jgi:hypothetical protein